MISAGLQTSGNSDYPFWINRDPPVAAFGHPILVWLSIYCLTDMQLRFQEK